MILWQKGEPHSLEAGEKWTWVRENVFGKGWPNMTVQTLCNWVNSFLLVFSHLPHFVPHEISLRTAAVRQKEVYIDMREKTLWSIEKIYWRHFMRYVQQLPPCSAESLRVPLDEDNNKRELMIIPQTLTQRTWSCRTPSPNIKYSTICSTSTWIWGQKKKGIGPASGSWSRLEMQRRHRWIPIWSLTHYILWLFDQSSCHKSMTN